MHGTMNIYIYKKMEYIGYWSQKRSGSLPPAQTTTKVNCKLHSQ